MLFSALFYVYIEFSHIHVCHPGMTLCHECNQCKSFDENNKCQAEIVSEYDQEIPQSQTADKPIASRGRATQQSRDNRKTN